TTSTIQLHTPSFSIYSPFQFRVNQSILYQSIPNHFQSCYNCQYTANFKLSVLKNP
ncbi:hypothetical protein KSS87_000657, partial [Heliosperma pusillum]